MKTLTKNYYLKVFLLVIFLLLLTKIDFRVTSYSNSSSVDDASYMYHAYTIGHDFDLEGVSDKFRYLKFSITSKYGSDTYVHGSEITLWGLDNVD